MTRHRSYFAAAAAIVLVTLIWPSAAQAQIKWVAAPYIWGANITVRGDINETDAIDRTRAFSSIVEDTDFAFMGYLEGRGERYGFFVDTAFLNLGSQEATLEVMPVGTPSVAGIESDAKTTLLDAVVFLRPAGGDSGLDVFIGLRYLDLDVKYDISYTGITAPTRLQVDENLINAIAGIRYIANLGQAWNLALRADAGAGDAKLTWNAQALAGYQFNEVFGLHFGYKYQEHKFESDFEPPSVGGLAYNVDSKLEFGGPLVGVTFRF
jgi:hypothetical protein